MQEGIKIIKMKGTIEHEYLLSTILLNFFWDPLQPCKLYLTMKAHEAIQMLPHEAYEMHVEDATRLLYHHQIHIY